MFGSGFGDNSGDISGFLTSPWQQASAVAASIANDGASEPNIDPSVRISYEQLVRVAELHLSNTTSLSLSPEHGAVSVEVVTRTDWAKRAIDAYKPLFDDLATNLGELVKTQLTALNEDDFDDMGEFAQLLPEGFDMKQILGMLSASLGPAMVVSVAGSTIGQLARTAFGTYDLPIPRDNNVSLEVCGRNVELFADEWSLPPDELRLWVCCNEMIRRAILGIDHINQRLTMLLAQHCASFELSETQLEQQLSGIDLDSPDSLEHLQQMLMNPNFVLEALKTPKQQQLASEIDVVVMAIEGYCDWILDRVGERLMGSYSMLNEAIRRRRVESDEGARFVDRLFGVELTQDKLDAALSFVEHIVELAGPEAAEKIWDDLDHLPTLAEYATPRLWCARVGLELPEPELNPSDFEIPDFPDLDA